MRHAIEVKMMIYAVCKDIEELREQVKKAYKNYDDREGKHFYSNSNIQKVDKNAGFEYVVLNLLQDGREDMDIFLQAYTDMRAYSIGAEAMMKEIRETEEYLMKQEGEKYWWMDIKENKEKYFGILFFVGYLPKDDAKQRMYYIQINQNE